MIVTLENVESIDGSNWLERPNLEDVESTGTVGAYWLEHRWGLLVGETQSGGC